MTISGMCVCEWVRHELWQKVEAQILVSDIEPETAVISEVRAFPKLIFL